MDITSTVSVPTTSCTEGNNCSSTPLSVAGAIVIGALCGVCVFLIFCLVVMAFLRKRQRGQQQRAGFVPRRLARLVSVHSIRRSSTDHHNAVANSEAPPDYHLCTKIETELNFEKDSKLLMKKKQNNVINLQIVNNSETAGTNKQEVNQRNDENESRNEFEESNSISIIDEEPPASPPPDYNHVQRNTSGRGKNNKLRAVETVT